MKNKIHFLMLIAVLALVLNLGTTNVSADSGSASYQYLIGSGLLCGINPAFCPDVAKAENGDTVSVRGTGTLSIHPDSVSGSGTFIHKNAAGAVLATGTWTAKQLLSFDSFGTAPGFPPTFNAGRALIRVHLSPATGGAGLDAILRVSCRLPGAEVPASTEEGIRLAVQDGPNFNKEAGGATLFIKLP